MVAMAISTGQPLGSHLNHSARTVTAAIGQLVSKLGLVRRGHTFYALRHTFETIGGESRDQVAVDAIMGHSREDMASVYRERLGDDRLRAVVEHVRRWLFEKSRKTKRQSVN
jgi:integrase